MHDLFAHVKREIWVMMMMGGMGGWSSLGMNSSMFANCSVFCDVRHVQSSILGQNVMFRKFDVRTFNVRSVQSYFGVHSKTIFYIEIVMRNK